jgi:alkenylglycerophosphocholine hydrolase
MIVREFMNQPAKTTERLADNALAPKPWLWLSLFCSAFYFVTKSSQPFAGSIMAKALSIAPLALLALGDLRGTERWLLGLALCFATLGDVLLDWPGNYFVPGLCAFLVTQLLYAKLFARDWQRPFALNATTKMLAVGVLLFSIVLTAWMWPSLGKLAVPVMVYIGALTLMVESALLAQFKTKWIVWGAVLFMISDSLIGVNRFKMDVPLRDYLVWATYYLGQCGIVLGYFQEKQDKR